jgi:hypothetical protein
MSFSAQTCLTNTGTTQLGSTLYFYSDVTGYQNSFGSDLTENLIGDNCPYTMENIPDGTSVVRIIDPTTNCCVDINLESNDLCNTYNLNFDVYDTQTVSQIVAGNLIGDNVDVTDYIINWYGPGSGSTEIAFTSGYGAAFTDIGWNLTHPLTGNSSPIVEAGIYTPVIDRVVIDGNTFSLTGIPDTYIANLDCFTSAEVTVDAIKCDNGNLPPGSIYSHQFRFDNVSVGNPPLGLSASFELSSTTNYIAWKFAGYSIYDTLKMTFYGSEYNYVPLIIENVRIGSSGLNTNVIPTANPKSIYTIGDFVRKVTCLTAFTINEGDYVTINITPNNITNNTIWDFNLKCLQSFDCTHCYDQYENSLAKIVTASTQVILSSCNRSSPRFNVNFCYPSTFVQSDTGKYLYGDLQTTVNAWIYYAPLGGGTDLAFNKISCTSAQSQFQSAVCSSPTTNTYSFEKTLTESGQGFISFSFNNLSDFQHYYNSYLFIMSAINASNDNTTIGYYKGFKLQIPNNSNPNLQCGDTTPRLEYLIHHTSQVVTGQTSPSGPYTLTMTMPTIIKNINFTSCELNCDNAVTSIVNSVNFSSQSPGNNIQIVTNTGSRYTYPFHNIVYVGYSNAPKLSELRRTFLREDFWSFQDETYVFSGNNVFVSSLSGRTCEPKAPLVNNNPSGGTSTTIFAYYYVTLLTDPDNLQSFVVTAPTISNYTIDTNNMVTAMTVTNGVVTYANPDYCI